MLEFYIACELDRPLDAYAGHPSAIRDPYEYQSYENAEHEACSDIERIVGPSEDSGQTHPCARKEEKYGEKTFHIPLRVADRRDERCAKENSMAGWERVSGEELDDRSNPADRIWTGPHGKGVIKADIEEERYDACVEYRQSVRAVLVIRSADSGDPYPDEHDGDDDHFEIAPVVYGEHLVVIVDIHHALEILEEGDIVVHEDIEHRLKIWHTRKRIRSKGIGERRLFFDSVYRGMLDGIVSAMGPWMAPRDAAEAADRPGDRAMPFDRSDHVVAAARYVPTVRRAVERSRPNAVIGREPSLVEADEGYEETCDHMSSIWKISKKQVFFSVCENPPHGERGYRVDDRVEEDYPCVSPMMAL